MITTILAATFDIGRDISEMMKGVHSQLDTEIKAVTGLSPTALRWLSVYVQLAQVFLFGYKLYIAYLTLRAAKLTAETAAILRSGMALAVVLVLPYGVGAWIVDRLNERTKLNMVAGTLLVSLAIILGCMAFRMMRFSGTFDLKMMSF